MGVIVPFTLTLGVRDVMLGIGTGAAITRLQGFLTLWLEASVHAQVVSHRYGALANSETRRSDDSMSAQRHLSGLLQHMTKVPSHVRWERVPCRVYQ
jgi:hypothetical protein